MPAAQHASPETRPVKNAPPNALGVMVEAAPTTAAPTTHRPDALEAGLERAAEQVFLSPRVVDQRSFDELSGTLQRVVREATAQGKSLMATGDQVRNVTDNLRALMRELQQRTDAATKVLPLMEAQAKRVQELTGRVTHEAALSKARDVRDAVMKAVDEERAKVVQSAKDQLATEVRDAVRAIVREEVERARTTIAEGLEARAAEAERRTEAAATEVSEQLAALRVDAAKIVAESRASLRAAQPTPITAPTPIAPPALPAFDAAALEQRVQSVTAAAKASIAASADEALSRVGAQITDLRTAGAAHTASLEELRALAARADQLVRDLSERVEAAAHATDSLHELDAAQSRPTAPQPAAPSPLSAPGLPAQFATALTGDLQQATVHAQQAGAWLVQLLTAADHVGRNLDALVRSSQQTR
ncbi:MAG TPA: hypothetical protein VHN77_16035 [Phycisphaerales bacterium]|nr:hypothetical protein [Phycisphaerales bacterium]